jgi:hypothetical protein
MLILQLLVYTMPLAVMISKMFQLELIFSCQCITRQSYTQIILERPRCYITKLQDYLLQTRDGTIS